MTITEKTGADKTPTNETSTDKISVQSKTSTKPSKRLVVMLAAGLLVVAGGITLTSVGVASAAADETARQCAVALKDSAAVTTSRTASLAKANAALEAVKSVALPANAGTSTVNAARPGVAAVKAVPAVEAVAGRASGAELIASVSTARRAPVKIAIPTKCTERDSATKILALTAKSTALTRTLDTSVTVLVADFAVFQVDETARIAAEIEASRVAADAEAARVAAEAAAAEAARVAAAQHAAASRPSSGGVRSGSSSAGGSSSGGSSGTPGGGGVGLGNPPPGTC